MSTGSPSEKCVTDAGLEHLKGLTKLNFLDLNVTQVTDAGLAEIKAALPKCKMRHLTRRQTTNAGREEHADK
ncbi:MAG TPA: hypothetical protein EYQ63_13760 [Fuerstia sp.]|nr:hypothetical protein [Fuerstiella sp.]